MLPLALGWSPGPVIVDFTTLAKGGLNSAKEPPQNHKPACSLAFQVGQGGLSDRIIPN